MNIPPPRQHVGVLHDGLVAGGVGADGEHAPPLGELAAVRLVLPAPLVQVVQALGRALALAPEQLLHTLVHLAHDAVIVLLPGV